MRRDLDWLWAWLALQPSNLLALYFFAWVPIADVGWSVWPVSAALLGLWNAVTWSVWYRLSRCLAK